MKLLLVDTAHVYKTYDGKHYTPTIYGKHFFQRYLKVFEEVRFVCRTQTVADADVTGFLEMDTEGLEFWEMPWYRGLKSMIKKLPKIAKNLRGAADGCDCVLLRMPQLEGYLCYLFSKCKNKPLALEIVSDPKAWTDVTGIFKAFNLLALKHLINITHGVSYVTRDYLQGRYPKNKRTGKHSGDYFTGHYSTAEIPDSIISVPKKYKSSIDEFEIIHVANAIEDDNKGHGTVIEVLSILKKYGKSVRAVFIGSGSKVPSFIEYADKLGVGDRVFFTGRLSSVGEIIKRLRQSDLFLFPSKSEGLPKVVIEAQASGLPCIASPVGGTPELIEEKYLRDPLDAQGFADIILRLLDTPSELDLMSEKNIETAKEYTTSVLEKRRTEFYTKLKNAALRA
jgi:glycosyltransferase involved in cell wall biosynthesis